MNKLKHTILLFLILAFLTPLIACRTSGSAIDFSYFNTIIHVETHDFQMSKQTENELEDLFSTLDSEFNCNNPTSFVYKINNAQANTEVQVSNNVLEVFNLSKTYFSFTDKKFSPAIYPLIMLWQFNDYPKLNFSLPNDSDILALVGEKTDFDKIDANGQTLSITKQTEDIKIDFGGILKGYAVDKAKDILKKAGHNSGYINIGGSSLYLLSVEKLSVAHPRADDNLSTILEINCSNIQGASVSTSGDYQKYYKVDGKIYSHIIDPFTGFPADNGVISATLIGGTGAFGDAITTALCLMEHQAGNKSSQLVNFINRILTQYPNSMIFVVYNKDGAKEIVTNKKSGQEFTLLDTSYSINEI